MSATRKTIQSVDAQIPSLHALSLNANVEIGAQTKRKQDGSEETQERPQSPSRERLPKSYDLDEKTEAMIMSRALSFGFAAMPAPMCEEAFCTVVCITTHRILEGFGILSEEMADAFDIAANEFLEFLAVDEILRSSGLDLADQSEVNASPYDDFLFEDFGKFKKAKMKPLPDSSIFELFVGHFDNISDFVRAVKGKKWTLCLTLMKEMAPQLIYIVASLGGQRAGPEGFWDDLDKQYEKIANGSLWPSMSAASEAFLKGLGNGSSFDALGAALSLAGSVLQEYTGLGNFFTESTAARVVQNVNDNISYNRSVLKTFAIASGLDRMSWDEWARITSAKIWQLERVTVGLFGLSGRVAFFVGHALTAIVERYIVYREGSMKFYLKANGVQAQNNTKKKILKKARKKRLYADMPLCGRFERAFKLWKEHHKAAEDAFTPGSKVKGVAGFIVALAKQASNMVVSVPGVGVGQNVLPYYNLVHSLMKLRTVEKWRTSTRKELEKMYEAFKMVSEVSDDLDRMQVQTRQHRRRLCGGGYPKKKAKDDSSDSSESESENEF